MVATEVGRGASRVDGFVAIYSPGPRLALPLTTCWQRLTGDRPQPTPAYRGPNWAKAWMRIYASTKWQWRISTDLSLGPIRHLPSRLAITAFQVLDLGWPTQVGGTRLRTWRT